MGVADAAPDDRNLRFCVYYQRGAGDRSVHRRAEIFSRAALARNAERVSPRSLAAASMAPSKAASKVRLARTVRPASISTGMRTAASPAATSILPEARISLVVRAFGGAIR